jgi:CRP/FNR family transcriptional regulator, cyclic AMP receptor protein
VSWDVSALGQIPLFTLLDGDELAALAGLLGTRHASRGETIFSRGDPGDSLWLVAHGQVRLAVEDDAGQTIVLAECGPGELFGEISLLDGGPRTATAVAVEDSELLVIGRDNLLAFLTRHPRGVLEILAIIGRRLRAADQLLVARVSRNINEEQEERMTLGQRVADKVAAFGGSWSFIFLSSFSMLLWILVNTLVLVSRPFDPFPFILLNLVLAMVTALQAPVIMMSQNRQAEKDRLKADQEYEVNLKAELEVAHLHRKVDRLRDDVRSGFASLGARPARDVADGRSPR